MPPSEKLGQLVQKLLERTTNGSASWSPGSRDDTYIWSGSNASVVVLTQDNDSAPPWIVRLVDGAGRIVEEEVFAGDVQGFVLVSKLYEAARADALDISATIDGLLNDLD